MDKITQEVNMNDILDLIKNDVSNNWDDLCNRCSSLVKESGMTDIEIDKIVKKCGI